jgi:hypothetical protein
MSPFSKKVFKAFQPLIHKHGFRPAKAAAHKAFAAVVARPAQDICYYVFARDDRSGAGELSAQLWVAPPDFPADGLDNLGVGFKFHLGNLYEPEEGFFEAVAGRVETLLPYLSGIAEAVRQELKEPAFRTRRFQVHTMQRALLDAVRKHSVQSGTNEWIALHEKAVQVVEDKVDFEDLEKACKERLSALLQSPAFRRMSGFDDFLRESSIAGSCLAEQLYIEALVPFEAAHSGQGNS